VIADVSWSNTLSEYGLNPEQLQTYIDSAQVLWCQLLMVGQLTNWVANLGCCTVLDKEQSK